MRTVTFNCRQKWIELRLSYLNFEPLNYPAIYNLMKLIKILPLYKSCLASSFAPDHCQGRGWLGPFMTPSILLNTAPCPPHLLSWVAWRGHEFQVVVVVVDPRMVIACCAKALWPFEVLGLPLSSLLPWQMVCLGEVVGSQGRSWPVLDNWWKSTVKSGWQWWLGRRMVVERLLLKLQSPGMVPSSSI